MSVQIVVIFLVTITLGLILYKENKDKKLFERALLFITPSLLFSLGILFFLKISIPNEELERLLSDLFKDEYTETVYKDYFYVNNDKGIEVIIDNKVHLVNLKDGLIDKVFLSNNVVYSSEREDFKWIL